jgi:hypothetical protein
MTDLKTLSEDELLSDWFYHTILAARTIVKHFKEVKAPLTRHEAMLWFRRNVNGKPGLWPESWPTAKESLVETPDGKYIFWEYSENADALRKQAEQENLKWV